MKKGLTELLRAAAPVAAITDRVRLSHAPQGTELPYVLVTQIHSEENKTLDGTGETRFVDFDIDCKASGAMGAHNLGNAVREYIQDYTGAAGDQTIGAVLLNNESTDYEPPTDASDVGIHVVMLDVTIQYSPV